MLQQGFDIEIAPDSVDVRKDSSTEMREAALTGGILTIGFSLIVFCMFIFLPGRRNTTSIWDDLNHSTRPSDSFTAAVVATVCIIGLTSFLFLWGVRLFFPSGEALHCDRSTFTASKIPWFNFRGQWKSQSFTLSDIANFRFAVTFRAKGSTFYGFRFLASGRNRKIFSGLEAPEAEAILKGLERLGLNVIHDPDMPVKIEETLRQRAGIL